jgi:hypothetical protein
MGDGAQDLHACTSQAQVANLLVYGCTGMVRRQAWCLMPNQMPDVSAVALLDREKSDLVG